jgi:transglutaminase-like putative cysteine protease
MRIPERRTLGLIVLATWLVVAGWHVRREYFQSEPVRLAAGARSLAPGSHWYVIRMDDVAIGVAQVAFDTTADGFTFRDEITLDVPATGRLHRSHVRTRIELDRGLDLRAFRFLLDSSIGRFSVDGTVRDSTSIDLVMDAGAGPQHSTLRLSPGTLLDGALALRMAASGALRVGHEFRARILDPSTLAERDVLVRVAARDTIIVPDSARLQDGRWVATLLDTIPTWRVEQRYGGVAITNWIDDDGQVVRAASPLGFTIERLYYELAQQEWRAASRRQDLASGYGALIEGTAIASNADLSRADERDGLAVRLLGVDLGGFDLDGGRQRLAGDTLFVTRETLPSAPYRLPYAGGGEPALELGATPLVQADHPRIVEAARRIAGGEHDPVVVARRLNDWVYRTLRKEITPSVPSALQVLDARQGDCNEHTVLYVALARALGLPARTAVGLVHIRGSFYYHAWPEVWLGDWVAVDPTLGQVPADASHLRFLVGGLARQVELIRLIGRLQLEVQ